jgi:hypothetical protein
VHWAAGAVADGGERELVDPAIAASGEGDAAVRLLRVGVHCAKPEPESRPTVAEAAWMVVWWRRSPRAMRRDQTRTCEVTRHARLCMPAFMWGLDEEVVEDGLDEEI